MRVTALRDAAVLLFLQLFLPTILIWKKKSRKVTEVTDF